MLASLAVLFNSLPLRLIRLDATPRLCLSMLCSALPLHCVTKPCLASATLCCSMLCRCNSFLRKTMPLRTFANLRYSTPLPIIAILRYSTPLPINAIPCHRNSTLFYANAILRPAMPCLSNSYYAYSLRLFCVSVQLALCSAAASLAVLLLHYAYASLNVTNPRRAYAFQRLTKP